MSWRDEEYPKVLRGQWCVADDAGFAESEMSAAYSPLLGKALWARGYRNKVDSDAWLAMGRAPLPGWDTVPDMAQAVERVAAAIRAHQPVAVFGDYDVDGLTATAIVVLTLQAYGVRVAWNIPERRQGYGLNRTVVDTMANWLRGHQPVGRCLLVVVDCGTSNRDEIALAEAAGLDVVVLDHHTVSGELPTAHTLVNPKRHDRIRAFREMSAAGLACYLVRGLLAAETNLPEPVDHEALKRDVLALAALGTAGDVAPLVADNRALVSWGLRAFRRHSRPGLQALLRSAGIESSSITAETLVWRIVPRLNAAGRMDNPMVAMKALLTEDPVDAMVLAAELERLNRRRQSVLEEMLDEARLILETSVDRRIPVLSSDAWQPGLVGLVAGRLADETGKPTIVLARSGDLARGSARSHPDFHIMDALVACHDLLEKYGGHKQAAGLTIACDQIEALAVALDAHAHRVWPDGPTTPQIPVDGVVRLADLRRDDVADVAAMEPFGQANEEPLWLVPAVKICEARRVGSDGAHLQLKVGDGSIVQRGIAFRLGPRRHELLTAGRVDLLCVAHLGTWQGQERLELQVRDVRPTGDR